MILSKFVRKFISNFGIRSLFVSLFVFLLAIILILSGALSRMTTIMHSDAKSLRTGLASVRAAQALKIDVLEYARFNFLYEETKDPKFQKQALAKERDIQRELEKSKNIELGSSGQEHVKTAGDQISEYLKGRREQTRQGGSIKKSSELLGETMAALTVLVDTNVQRANNALDASARMERYGDYLAIVSLGLFLLTALGILFVGIRYIYRPLRSIHSAISDFSKGRLDSRAPEAGVAELKYIASEFNLLAEQILSNNQKKAQFLAGTAHDLKNPLSSLRMAIHLLRDDLGQPTETQQRKLDLMDRQVTHLLSLTSGFLDTVQIEAGKFELNFQSIDLAKILRDAVELWSTMTDNHSIVSKIPSEANLAMCDPVRINQIITNLLSNAIKYSPDGGVIEISLQKVGEYIEIVVKDFGVGIPPSEINKIFEPFQRSPSVQKAIPGIGIGLWVARQLVEAHSGSIVVDSKTGIGTTFTVRIPMSPKMHKADGHQANRAAL